MSQNIQERERLDIWLTPLCRMSAHRSLAIPRLYLNYSILLSVVKNKQFMERSRLSHFVDWILPSVSTGLLT